MLLIALTQINIYTRLSFGVYLGRKLVYLVDLIFYSNVVNRVHRNQDDSTFLFWRLLLRAQLKWQRCLKRKKRRLVLGYFLGFELR